MRTEGDFKEIYDVMKNAYIEDNYEDMPMNPVIRFEDGIWMLESGLYPDDKCIVKCTAEQFDDWFYEAYRDDSFVPDIEYEKEFKDAYLCERNDD